VKLSASSSTKSTQRRRWQVQTLPRVQLQDFHEEEEAANYRNAAVVKSRDKSTGKINHCGLLYQSLRFQDSLFWSLFPIA
jgi:hypothetical protein